MTHNPAFLYVEDDDLSRQVVKMLIEDVLGYANLILYETSLNFEENIKELNPAPDVIFLDIQMQPLDGYMMLKILKADPRFANATIIAMTANVMATDVEHLQQAGFHGLIGKPIRKKIFPDLLDKILRGESVWFIP